MLAIASAEEFHAAVAASASSGKTLVACFSAPWCGGCKLVAPKVAELAQQLAASADFAKVSAEELESLCEELEVDSYPHFRVYQEGKRAGDYTSSKFEKVDAFIRGFVAPETLQTEATEETPEGDAAETEGAAEEATEEAVETAEEAVEEEGTSSKKRQERDGMEANDEHVDKKAKTEEEALTEEAADAEEAVEDAEKTEETAEVAENEEEEVAEAMAEEAEKEASADKVEEEAAPVDKLEASGSAEVEADAAAA